MNDLDRFFSRRGKALKFETVGTSHELHITGDVEMQQQTDFDDPTILLWWDEEKTRPKMQALVPGKVTKGLTGPDDDGDRTLYIKGYMQTAVANALKEAGAGRPEKGGVLTVTYTHNGEKKGRGKPPKMYSASYVAPSAAQAGEFFASDGEQSTQHEDVPAQRTRKAAKATVAAGDDEEAPF